jgi:CubicO group peptidase (beta-lactamase class C family)
MNVKVIILIALFPFWTLSQQYKSSIDSLLKNYTQEGFGITSLVSKNGAIDYKNAFGKADIELDIPLSPANKFQIGSITKQFTAVLILKLEEEGKLNLTDSIQKYIPEFPTRGETITIEHLLTHTSGIPEYMDWEKHHDKWNLYYSPKQLIRLIIDQPLDFKPGDNFEYCNSNYLLLGQIIERVTGNSFNDYLKSEIFDKVGMTNSSTDDHNANTQNLANGYTRTNDQIKPAQFADRSWAYSAGNIISTVDDLNLWYQHLFNGNIISLTSLGKALTPFILNNSDSSNYGYGWYLENFQDAEMIYHGGSMSGFYSYVSYLPKTKVLTVILANCECIPYEYIGRNITAFAIGKPLAEKKIIELDSDLLQSYSGIYKVDKNRNFIVKKKKEQLYGFFEESPDEGYNLFATQEAIFFSNEIGYDFEFILKKRNRVMLKITIPRHDKEPLIKTLSKKK